MKYPGPKPLPLEIPQKVRAELEAQARRTTAAASAVQRARIILESATGASAGAVAARVGCGLSSVRKWRARFRAAPCLDSLVDLPRPGRPAQVPPEARCEVLRLACERPTEDKSSFRDVWTVAALALALEVVAGIVLSVAEVGRILRNANVRPHRVRYWLNSTDPHFGEKAKRICDLYLDAPPGATVLCIDEKPVQVLGRKFPMVATAAGVVRKEYEYIRRGTCCLLAAFNVRTGAVFGRVVDHRTADQTVNYMEEVAKAVPTGEVYVIWDNLNTHADGPDKRWTAFNERHGNRFHFVHTPIHASWLNQVECWFSILEKRILKHADFDSVAAASQRIVDYIDYWNEVQAHPFKWTWRYQPKPDRLAKAA